MLDNNALADVTREVWTADAMQRDMLWPGPLVLGTYATKTSDGFVVGLWNPGLLYSYVTVKPPIPLDARSASQHIDRRLEELRQLHFTAQAHHRGGYS